MLYIIAYSAGLMTNVIGPLPVPEKMCREYAARLTVSQTPPWTAHYTCERHSAKPSPTTPSFYIDASSPY